MIGLFGFQLSVFSGQWSVFSCVRLRRMVSCARLDEQAMADDAMMR
jgi:hypothetical protein